MPSSRNARGAPVTNALQASQQAADTALSPQAVATMRTAVPEVADNAVAAILDEVPAYADALVGPMGATINNAVQLALGGFLTLAGREKVSSPAAPAIEGAYQLGRGEARSGRTVEALLAAYRIGARVSWRHFARLAVATGADPEEMVGFAELVFAYIDELSASSVAGHSDELERSGRVRQRNLQHLARALLTEASADDVVAAAERAGWDPPRRLVAVVLPQSQVGHALSANSPQTLVPSDEVPGQPDGMTTLLVPSSGSSADRRRLLGVLKGTDAVVGPAVPWLEVAASFDRATRCQTLDVPGVVDTEAHLPELVLGADPAALADLRTRVLAPLHELRPTTAEKLTETLRAWLLHHGRREAVATALFVHPQTVRYRVGQLRELYGDSMDDPRWVLEATLALA